VLSAVLLACGCGDEIVGEFAGGTGVMGGSGGGSGQATTGEIESTGPGAQSSGGSTTGEPPPTWTEGCFFDDFEDGVLAAMWHSWNEADSAYVEAAGVLKFDPATDGLWDAGIVADFQHTVTFDGSSTRVQVPMPPNPGQPVVLFLQMIDDQEDAVAITISAGVLSTWNTAAGQQPIVEDFPAEGVPAWVGLRGVGSQVQFERSDDNVEWTVFAQRETAGELGASSPLIMVQTYGSVVAPDLVQIDNFETCVD
jgi:hypothetical protein